MAPPSSLAGWSTPTSTPDRPLFERELKAVLAAPEDVLPGRHRLLTVVAQRKARRLLQQADTLFASKPSSSER